MYSSLSLSFSLFLLIYSISSFQYHYNYSSLLKGANYPPPPKGNSVIGNSTGSPSLPKSSSSTGSSSSSSIADFALTPDVLKKVDPKDRKSYSFMKQNTNKNDNIPSAPNGPNGAGGPRRMLLGECDEHEVILNSVDGQLENVDQVCFTSFYFILFFFALLI